MNPVFLVSALLCLLFCFFASCSAEADPGLLFADDAAMNVQVTAPLSVIMRDRDNPTYREGTVRHLNSAGNAYEIDVDLRARGNFRRRRNICQFAPLRLKFSGEQPPNSMFKGQTRLKLVTHCDSGSSIYEQNILKEFLAYRIFGLVSELSFRVRLLHVTYIDTSRNNARLTKYAFLIEDRDSVALRTGMPLSSSRQIDATELEPAQTNLVTVFQYLIGNTDFSAVLGAANDVCCHNVVLLIGAGNRYVPIPYDFDLAGIVNAPYAAPNPKYGIDKVTDRLFRGLCSNIPLLTGTLERYRDVETDVRRLIDEQVGLRSAEKVRMQRYVDGFYEDVVTEKAIRHNLVESCNQ